jgi:hypothetical protein
MTIAQTYLSAECPDSGCVDGASVKPGETISALRMRARQKPRDIELQTAAIASKTGDPSFFVSHSHLHQIETQHTVPGIFKLCSLAACLQVSIEELLHIYGLDLAVLREMYGFRLASQIPAKEPCASLRKLREIASQFRHTDLISRDIQEQILVPYLAMDPGDHRRYTFGIIGQDDGKQTDHIPPGTLVQIDRRYSLNEPNALPRTRPVYFVWYDKGYICSWCELDGKDLTVIPFSPERKLIRLRIPRSADIIGKVVGTIQFFD